MSAQGASHPDRGLEQLFETSPDPNVHTSAAAESGFVLALAGLLAAPFSVMHAVALALAVVGSALALGGMVATSNPRVSGRALVPLAFAFAAITLVTVGLRYLGLDTAFGDALRPALQGWLESLNSFFAQP